MKKLYILYIILAAFLMFNCEVPSGGIKVPDAPAAPTVTGSSPTYDTTPTWSWNTPVDTTKFRYRLDLGTWIETADTSTTLFTPAAALSYGSHTLEVQGIATDSDWSTSGSFTIFIAIPAPSGISASSGIQDQININWNPVTDIAEYHVYRSTTESGGYIAIGASTSTSYADTTAIPGTTYYYKVAAESSLGVISEQSTSANGFAQGTGVVTLANPAVTVTLGTSHTSQVYVNTGTNRLCAYKITITYNPSILGVINVTSGADGFITAINTATPGTILITGFDSTGKGPSTSLHLLNIQWSTVGTGTSILSGDIDYLTNQSYMDFKLPGYYMNGAITVE